MKNSPHPDAIPNKQKLKKNTGRNKNIIGQPID